MADVQQPTEGSKWTHHNGNLYVVLLLANQASTKPEYPVTVVYQGNNGNIWSRLLSDWHRSFTFLALGTPRYNPGEEQEGDRYLNHYRCTHEGRMAQGQPVREWSR